MKLANEQLVGPIDSYRFIKNQIKVISSTLFLFISCVTCFSQEKQVIVFENEVKNQYWICEDSIQTPNLEIIGLSFTNDTLTHAYINFIEGFYFNACNYELIPKDKFFEIEVLECRYSQSEINFIYGYLKSDKLHVLMTTKKAKNYRKLKQMDGWIVYSRDMPD